MPRGGPMGRGGDPTDKAKDFKGAMKRLFSELKPFNWWNIKRVNGNNGYGSSKKISFNTS